MPLSDSELSTLIQSELKSAPIGVIDDPTFKDWADSVASAIVSHITANATVTVVIPSGSSAGTYTGTVS